MAADPLIHYQLTARVSQFMFNAGRIVYERAPDWAVPTLLLYSGRDRLIAPKSCERFAALVPPGLIEAHSYADTAHSLFQEAGRVQVLGHICQWLDRVK
jgi:alpha-beta hydrolase superfamily lysophospholipase